MPGPLKLTKNQLDFLNSIDDKLEQALSGGVSDGSSLIVDPMKSYSDDKTMGGGDHDKAEDTRKGIKSFLKAGLAAMLSQLDIVPATQVISGAVQSPVIVKSDQPS